MPPGQTPGRSRARDRWPSVPSAFADSGAQEPVEPDDQCRGDRHSRGPGEAPSWVVRILITRSLFPSGPCRSGQRSASHFHQGRHAPRPLAAGPCCPAALPSPWPHSSKRAPPAGIVSASRKSFSARVSLGVPGSVRHTTGDVTRRAHGSAARWLTLVISAFLRLLQQRRHVGPQPLAGGAFLRGQFRQGRLIADAGEVFVLLPVAQRLLHPGAVGGWAAIQLAWCEGPSRRGANRGPAAAAGPAPLCRV